MLPAWLAGWLDEGRGEVGVSRERERQKREREERRGKGLCPLMQRVTWCP